MTMKSSIDRHVTALHEGEQKREELRAKLASDRDELAPELRDRLEGEIAVVSSNIESHARNINAELRACAQRGYAPSAPTKLDSLRDPDLRAFGAQVKATLARLKQLGATNDARLAQEKLKLGRDRVQVKKLRKDSLEHQDDLESEEKKQDDARKALERDRRRLEAEQKKLEKEREHSDEQRDRVAKEREELDDRLDDARDQQKKLESERREAAARLRTTKDPKQRAALERTMKAQDDRTRLLDRQIAQDKNARDQRVRSIEQSMGREKTSLEEARQRFEKELARLDQENDKLDRQGEKLARARKAEDERLRSIGSLEAQLEKEPR